MTGESEGDQQVSVVAVSLLSGACLPWKGLPDGGKAANRSLVEDASRQGWCRQHGSTHDHGTVKSPG